MEDLLNPDKRVPKITKFDVDVPIPLGLRVIEEGKEKQVVGLTVVLPQGTTSSGLGTFQHKAFANDLIALRLKPESVEQKLTKNLGEEEGKALTAELRALGAELVKDPSKPIETARKHQRLIEAYRSCTADVENDGHPFGQDLSDADKKALIAFLATL
jgi:hypothetical protein